MQLSSIFREHCVVSIGRIFTILQRSMPFFLLFALSGFENSAIRNNLPRSETMIDIISSTILGMLQAFLSSSFFDSALRTRTSAGCRGGARGHNRDPAGWDGPFTVTACPIPPLLL